MLDFLDPIVQGKGCKMSHEERILYTVACKNIVQPLIKTYRTIIVIETYDRFQKNKDAIEEYKLSVIKRYDEECNKIILSIQRNFIDTGEGEPSEGLAYFYKLKADYFRYIAEVYP